MGRLRGTWTFQAREDIERHFSGDFGNWTCKYDFATQDCERLGLGGELLAKYEEEQAKRLSESPVVLPYGCSECLDGKCYIKLQCRQNLFLNAARIGISISQDHLYIITYTMDRR